MLHRARRNRIEEGGGVDMTPMLDIVFIMLIFFIVTSVFLDESGMSFASPPDSPAPVPDTPAITVYVDASDRIAVDNQATELSTVGFQVQRLLAEKPNADVIIRAHPQASLNPIVFVQDQMNLAGRPTILKIDPPQ